MNENEITQIYALKILLEWGQFHPIEGCLRRITKRVWELAHLVEEDRGRKPSINVTVVGPYRSGKSTLLGLALFLRNQISHSEFSKLQHFAGMEKYRCLVDHRKTEIELGRTEDISHRHFECKNHVINFINTPGKPKLIRNRVSGIFQGDHTVLVVEPSMFTPISKELIEITLLLKIVRVMSVIVVVNKIDLIQAEDEGESTFHQIVNEWNQHNISKELSHIPVTFIPVSAKNGTNIDQKGFPWFRGESLFSHLENLKRPLQIGNYQPLRMMIDKAYNVKGVGTVVCGTIISGILMQEQLVKIGPINKIVRVKSLHLATQRMAISKGYPGDYVAINVPGLRRNECHQRRFGLITACVGGQDIEDFNNGKLVYTPLKKTARPIEVVLRKREIPLHPCVSFVAYGIFFGIGLHELKQGFQFTMHCHNSQVPVSLEQFVSWNPKKNIGCQLLTSKEKIVSFEPESPLRTLTDDAWNMIFSWVGAKTMIRTIPMVCKELYLKSLSQTVWNNFITESVEKRSFTHGISDPRREYQFYHLKDAKNTPIRTNEHVIFRCSPFARALGIDTYASCPKLGTILIREGTQIIGAAKIIHCTQSDGTYRW